MVANASFLLLEIDSKYAMNHTRNGTAKNLYSRTRRSTEAIVKVRGENCDVHMSRSGPWSAVDVHPNEAAEGR